MPRLPKTRRTRLTLAVAAAAAVLAVSWWWYRPLESHFLGRPASWWAEEYGGAFLHSHASDPLLGGGFPEPFFVNRRPTRVDHCRALLVRLRLVQPSPPWVVAETPDPRLLGPIQA